MAISEHVEEFAGLPVHDYDPVEGIIDPTGHAHCLSVGDNAAEQGATFATLIERFLSDPSVGQVSALVIGDWGDAYDSSNTSEGVVQALVAARDRLPALRAIFLGEHHL
jgi:hypothetical protein